MEGRLISRQQYGRKAHIQAAKFPQLISEENLDKLDDEWRALQFANDTVKGLGVDMNPVQFWDALMSVKVGNGDLTYGTLGKFMCTLLALPHSSACVERIFSEVNMVKTPQTNRLHASTVANRILSRQTISRQGAPCRTWQPPKVVVEDVQYGRCHTRRFVTGTLTRFVSMMWRARITIPLREDNDAGLLVSRGPTSRSYVSHE